MSEYQPGRNSTKISTPSLEILAVRDRLLQIIREYFRQNDFLEVTTPSLVAAPAPEPHIRPVSCGAAFLRTSPELEMKIVLASGCRRIFQIGPCFRRDEQGRFHHPEFTMLEWYRTYADDRDLIADARIILQRIAHSLLESNLLSWQGIQLDLGVPWECISVREAFMQAAGWDPIEDFDENRFNTDLVERVEPWLPHDRPVLLKDYPAAAGGLARLDPDDPRVARRWELYVAGIELINACAELTDPAEYQARFDAAHRLHDQRGWEPIPENSAFLEAASHLPPCAGAALGIDRLMMLLTDQPDIHDVLIP